MKRTVALCCLLLTIVAEFTCAQAARGVRLLPEYLDPTEIGRQYLLLIAIDEYQFIPSLRNPVSDAQEIRDILTTRYITDEVIELYNEEATKSNILAVFQELQNGLQTHDSLLIFYAGHGRSDDISGVTFWMPVDAGADGLEQSHWLPHPQVVGLISNIEALNICLISDSCFSGDILDTDRGSGMPDLADIPYLMKAYRRTAREVITSAASEASPDRSEIALQLKMALKKNTHPFLDTMTLYNEIKLGVKETTPLYGALRDAGHQEGGSFLFFLREGRLPAGSTVASQWVESVPLKITEQESKQRLYTELNSKLNETQSLLSTDLRITRNDIDAISTLNERIRSSKYLFDDLLETGDQLYQTALQRIALWERLDDYRAQLKETTQKLSDIDHTVAGWFIAGWSAVGVGLLGIFSASVTQNYYFLAYENYLNAVLPEDRSRYMEEYQFWESLGLAGAMLTVTSGCAATVSFVLGFQTEGAEEKRTLAARKAELTESIADVEGELRSQ